MSEALLLERALEQANSYIELRRFDRAMAVLREQLTISPNEGKLHYLMAQCFYEKDELEKASESCRECLEKGILMLECQYLLGLISMERKDYPLSEKHFLSALEIEPEDPEVLSSYGLLMLRTGHEKKSKLLFDEAMRIDPENDVVLANSLIFYLCKNNRVVEYEIMGKCLENSRSEIHTLVRLGICNIHHNNYKEARENFREAYLLDPSNKWILEVLEDLTRETHAIFLPNRCINKLGGPAVIWLFIVLLVILSGIVGESSVIDYILLVYVIFAVYTWISPLLYKLVSRVWIDGRKS